MSVVICILFCIVSFGLGAAFHAVLARELAASKADLATWASRLRLALAQDEKTAKTAVDKIASEIEKKV